MTTSRGCPDATTTPSAMTTNRSHTAAASVRSCGEHGEHGRARASASSRIKPVELDDVADVEMRRGLVERRLGAS